MRRYATPAAFALAAATAWIGLGSYGLVEPSDARYAEIAREMFESGDYLFPRLFGIHHFHKPPLLYWLSSAGYGLFGVNEWGARACLGAMSLALALVLWRFARRHLGPGAGVWAVASLATTPAVIGAGRMLTTDLLLCLCLTVALASWYDVWSGKGGRGALVLFYGSAGLAFLAKGPVAWLLLVLVIGPFWLFERGRSPKRKIPIRGLRWGVPLCVLLAFSWYAYAAAETPGLLSYFLGGQLASRLREGGLGHPHPWFYYAGVFPALGLPWVFFALSGWVACRERTPPLAIFLALWALMPPLFFSVPATKLPLYVLPAYPALALLAAASLSDDLEEPTGPLQWAAWLFLLLGAVLGLVGLGVIPLRAGDLAAVPRGALGRLFLPLSLAALFSGVYGLARARAKPARAAACLAAGLAALPAWGFSQGDLLPLRSARIVGLAAHQELRQDDLLVEYRDLAAGVPFYTGRIPVLAEIQRELQFEGWAAEDRVIGSDKLRELWEGPRRVLVITRDRKARDLPGARRLAQGGGFVLLANR